MEHITCKINDTFTIKPPENKYIFNGNDKWLIEISSEGIKFNHKDNPNFTPDDFAKEFISIVEKYIIKNF